MISKLHTLKNGDELIIREVDDVRMVLDYIEDISGESDFLSFGPGEFGLTEPQRKEFLLQSREVDNRIFILAETDGRLVGPLGFSAGHRPRIRHPGEFGRSVRKEYWGLGIGSPLVDALIDWARGTQI
jgi:RimJ/RimL family protein N-acetyltransferase